MCEYIRFPGSYQWNTKKKSGLLLGMSMIATKELRSRLIKKKRMSHRWLIPNLLYYLKETLSQTILLCTSIWKFLIVILVQAPLIFFIYPKVQMKDFLNSLFTCRLNLLKKWGEKSRNRKFNQINMLTRFIHHTKPMLNKTH